MVVARSSAAVEYHEPSREDQRHDEQIEDGRNKLTSDVRMKKHPELWPHVPADRYGVSGKRENSTLLRSAQTKDAPHQGTRTPTNTPRQNLRKVNSNGRLSEPKGGLPPARVDQRRLSSDFRTIVPAGSRRTTSSIFNKTETPNNRITNFPNHVAPSNRTTVKSAKLEPKNAFPTPPNHTVNKQQQINQQNHRQAQPQIYNQSRQQVGDSRYPEDSGVEIDSSLVDVPEGHKENDCRQDKSTSEQEEKKVKEDFMRLEKARQELDELARREAEDRKQRQMIVENILSKFSANP